MSRTGLRLRSVVLACILPGLVPGAEAAPPERAAIVSPREASFPEILAAREVRRYLYLRTGRLLEIVEAAESIPQGLGAALVVARKDQPLLAQVKAAGLESSLASLSAQNYLLKTVDRPGGRLVLIAGGDGPGVLYGAYRFAEHLGVRFYLHGDVVPDAPVDLRLPVLDERAGPLFDLRGIQPFHDFPEGPDWWGLDDYRSVISQLPKLRMNFIGLHTYPEAAPVAEPTVWIGPPAEVGEGGKVAASYPSSYQNTCRESWGYTPVKTGDFHLGAAELFERDDHGSEVMVGLCPEPSTPEASNVLFERTAAMLRQAFLHARRLGIKTCLGTETPLTVPKLVKERLRAGGKDPADPAVLRELYEGIFLRAARAYPLDYYWFWTPEGWTWEGVSSDRVAATIKDLTAAIEAAKRVSVPFQLATCGWVLGPQDDRALFDRALPPGMAVSCINREVGNTPVDPAFARVERRPKWAIPWLEDDPGLTSPQLWVGRMRRDAADALRYRCTGLAGIHWRTRVLGPNVAALARAAWDQAPWNGRPDEPFAPPRVEGPQGGQAAAFAGHSIAGAAEAPLYQTVRYGVSAYRFAAPPGKVTVTLKFCEPHYAAAGKRVFGVKIQGRDVISKLDIFAEVGQDRALDRTFEGIEVRDGWLDIEFVPVVEFPSIAAISVEGPNFRRRVNCGGPAYQDYAADWPATPPARDYRPVGDFYQDWALAEFGPEVGAEAAKVFERIDGALPRTSDWTDGPGGLKVDSRAWDEVRKEYSFVDELGALRPRVRGAGSRERLDYWWSTFRSMRAAAELRCEWARYEKAVAPAREAKDPAEKAALARKDALPIRKNMVKLCGEVFAGLLAAAGNPGELGTVANWEQHILPAVLGKPAGELERLLGEPLPAEARLGSKYEGRPRIIVPTLRTSVAAGEVLALKVIVLAQRPPREATLRWRQLGQGDFATVDLVPVARGVYSVKFPPAGAQGLGLEYSINVAGDDGEAVEFPATAPALNQTLVVVPAGEGDGASSIQ
jgi:malectin (di-glucose binding ER protein)